MEVIVKKTSLEELHLMLEGCMNISSVGLYAVIDNLKRLPKLTLLEVTLSGISDPLMENLTQSISVFSKLRSLTLRFGAQHTKHGSLSDKGVKLLAQALESVQDLTNFSLDIYRGDWHVTDEGIIRLRDAIQKLTKLISLRLNLRGLESITQAGVGHLNEALVKLLHLQKLHLNFKSGNEASTIQLKVPLSVLTGLKHLHLDFSWGVSDSTISELKKAFLQLTELNYLYINFSGCKDLTDAGATTLKEILSSLPKLNSLHLEFPWCYNLTDQGLGQLAVGISKIEDLHSLILNFERGGKADDTLTDVGVAAIIDSLEKKNNLKVLNLNFSSCVTLTNNILLRLGEVLPKVSELNNLTLDFRLCENIEDSGIRSLKNALEVHKSVTTILLNFMWCDKISDESIDAILKLKKARQFQQLLVAFKKNETQEEEGSGCQIF